MSPDPNSDKPVAGGLSRETLLELLPLYALDALEREARDAVEALLVEEPELRKEIRTYEATLSRLPEGLDPKPPDPRVRERLLARIAADARREERVAERDRRPEGDAKRSPQGRADSGWSRGSTPRWSLRGWLTSGALAIVALTFAIWAYALEVRDLRQELATLRAESRLLEDELESIRIDLETERAFAQLASAPNAEFYALGPTGDAAPGSRAFGRMVIDPGSKAGVLSISQLEALRADQDYQLWLIDEGGPKSFGIFDVEARGRAIVRFEAQPPIDFSAIGISIEPRGGSPAPTGPIVLFGERDRESDRSS